MSKIIFLSNQFLKTLYRDKFLVVLIFILPVLLIFVGAMSAPDREVLFIMDGQIVNPAPETVEISVILYSLTGLVLVASIISFYLGMNLNKLVPRLKQYSYTTPQIISAFLLVVILINLLITLMVTVFSLNWLDVNDMIGYFLGLFLSSLLFSTFGLIISKLVDTTALGLYLILTISILDTAFLENPLFSRRYNEDWMNLMPAYYSIKMAFRAIFDLKENWYDDIQFVLFYEAVLVAIYLIINYFKKS